MDISKRHLALTHIIFHNPIVLVLKTLVLFGLVASCGIGNEPQYVTVMVDITEQSWIAPDTDQVWALTTRPVSCLNATLDEEEILAGALLFNSPLLLGGQASKAGLRCASCHQNGRGNPHFLFNGISGAPGTADVTNGLFSRIRADKIINPVRIPDLATAEGRSRVDRTVPNVLEAFLKDQITEEFEGPEPSNTVITNLAVYIRALEDTNCDQNQRGIVTWQDEMQLIQAGLADWDSILLIDKKTARAYGNAMRAALERLYERYPDPEIRARLIDVSAMIKDTTSKVDIQNALGFLRDELLSNEDESFYNASYLERAL